jgi:hypothetical protein
MTSVVRVPEPIRSRLAEAVLSGGADISPHYIYPADDLHVTIANLDGYHDVPPDLIAEKLRSCLHQVGPVRLGLRGLAISRATVFAQAHVVPVRALLHLRHALRPSLAARDLAIPRGPAAAIGFCNVLRFRDDDIAIARALAKRHNRTGFGSFPIREIEIVRTDKVFSAANTVVLAKCARGDRAAHHLQ